MFITSNPIQFNPIILHHINHEILRVDIKVVYEKEEEMNGNEFTANGVGNIHIIGRREGYNNNIQRSEQIDSIILALFVHQSILTQSE